MRVSARKLTSTRLERTGGCNDLQEILSSVDFSSLEPDGYSLVCPPQRCVLLLHIHVLPSTTAFFRRLIRLGFEPASIVVVPKPYSTISSAEADVRGLGCTIIPTGDISFTPGGFSKASKTGLKKGVFTAIRKCETRAVSRCILVDDGGLLTDTWCAAEHTRPDLDVVSVQQTESGMYWRRLLSPVARISVARSPAKVLFESKIVVQGVLDKISSLDLLNTHQTFGVIGLGNIGSRLGRLLIERRHRVVSYDLNPLRWHDTLGRQQSLRNLIKKADIIFGCTGRNTMHHCINETLAATRNKVFVSLSSRDVEFQTLLERVSASSEASPYDTVEVPVNANVKHSILNGGFPINFDRNTEWESEINIALTRALVLLGILQGLCTPRSLTLAPQRLALSGQRALVKRWLGLKTQSPAEYGIEKSDIENLSWWRRKTKQSRLVHHPSFASQRRSCKTQIAPNPNPDAAC